LESHSPIETSEVEERGPLRLKAHAHSNSEQIKKNSMKEEELEESKEEDLLKKPKL
jgi:hypothetical protein